MASLKGDRQGGWLVLQEVDFGFECVDLAVPPGGPGGNSVGSGVFESGTQGGGSGRDAGLEVVTERGRGN